MRLGSTEHYGWDDWYAVSVRHVFTGDHLRVATRNVERHALWCVIGDEGRVEAPLRLREEGRFRGPIT